MLYLNRIIIALNVLMAMAIVCAADSLPLWVLPVIIVNLLIILRMQERKE